MSKFWILLVVKFEDIYENVFKQESRKKHGLSGGMATEMVPNVSLERLIFTSTSWFCTFTVIIFLQNKTMLFKYKRI